MRGGLSLCDHNCRAEYNPAPDLAIALAVPKQDTILFYLLKSYLILFGTLKRYR